MQNIFDSSRVPENDSKYVNINTYLEKYKLEFTYLKRKKYSMLDEGVVEKLEDNVYNCLLILADLTIPVFNLMDDISETYFMHPIYKGKPDEAKKDWLSYYRGLHEKPDELKNKAHWLLNKIERAFPQSERKTKKIHQYENK